MTPADFTIEAVLRNLVREEVQLAQEEILRAIREEARERDPSPAPGATEPEFVSTKHAARFSGFSVPTVRRWIKQRLLSAHRRGRAVCIRLDELRTLMASVQLSTKGKSVDLDKRANEILARSLRESR